MVELGKKILVSIADQKLLLLQDKIKIAEYPISTSKFGIGNKSGSKMTPLGYHIIKEKVGDNVPQNSIYKDDNFTKEIAVIDYKKIDEDDLITSRVMKLVGLESGINKGGEVDSFERGIWIHGTVAECDIGSPASHGCIRMKNEDIIKLYNMVDIGVSVEIKMELIEKVQDMHKQTTKRQHSFRLANRREKGVFDNALWKLGGKERRKKERRKN